MLELRNTAIVTGTINGSIISQTSNEVITQLINDELNDIILEKFANKIAWATGTLTFTLVVENPNDVRFNDIVINDYLDPNLIYLITSSVRINDIPVGFGSFNYDRDSGLLSINIPELLPYESLTITFTVAKARIEIFMLENYATLISHNQNSSRMNISTANLKRNISTLNETDVKSNVVIVRGLSRASKCRANEINLKWRNNC